jgi:hypothetical protein
MNKTTFIVVAVAALLVAGSFGLSQASTSSGDPRLDQIIEQNEKILKNQEDMQKQLAQIKDWVDWLRRRSS